MGADQQFCLRWNNFHTNITSAFESLRDDEDFVDITLASEGKQIKAHKMVLSACSPYFRSLLKGNPCQHPIVFLKDVTFANLTSILDFMYHGEVNVSHNELATFLKTAEALKVRGLAEDEKKKEAEGYNEASSPPPPRDPPDPGSPRPGEEANSAPDTHNSDSPPPKRQRRRSGASIHSAEDTNETVLSEARENSVKNEPQDFIEDEADMLIHNDTQDIIKHDTEENSEERNFGLSESVTISRSQAAMQQLQESFGSFLPGMGQSPGFLPHGATDMSRPPPYSLEGVQGLPPGISALPGPSMSQGAASQDASQENDGRLECPHCNKLLKGTSLRKHLEDMHTVHMSTYECKICRKHYRTPNSLQNHQSRYHRTQTRGMPWESNDLETFPSTLFSHHASTLSPQLTSLLAQAAAAQAGSNPHHNSTSHFLNGGTTALLNGGSSILNGGSHVINGGSHVINGGTSSVVNGGKSTHIKGGISFNIPHCISGGNMDLSNGNMDLSNGNISVHDEQGKPSILYRPAECPLCKRTFFNKYSLKRHMIQAHGENLVHTRPYARGESSCGGPPSVSSPFSALMAMGTSNIQDGKDLDSHDQQLQQWVSDTSTSQCSTAAAADGYFEWTNNHQTQENTWKIDSYQKISVNPVSFPSGDNS